MGDYRPTVLVDFDGVLHTYSRGWADGTVYDPPIPGSREAMEAMVADGYLPVIFSTRPAEQIRETLARWGWPAYEVTNEKRKSVALIDDRAIRFVAWPTALAALRANYPVRTDPPAYRPERVTEPGQPLR